jgi:hypothetical protein
MVRRIVGLIDILRWNAINLGRNSMIGLPSISLSISWIIKKRI